MKKVKRLMMLLIAFCVFCCELTNTEVIAAEAEQYIQNEDVALREVQYDINVPVASGTVVYENETVILDASNVTDGYVMLKYNGTNGKVKFCVDTPNGERYSYPVKEYDEYVVLPLTCGNGSYTISVLESYCLEDSTYTVTFSQELDVNILNEYSPFLLPNIYAEYSENSDVVKTARELAENCYGDFDVVSNVYDYIINEIVYDYDEAVNVESGYVPNPDEVLCTGKGICFDYASLMTVMLRSQNIPTRLNVGYAGKAYHAWVSCYIDGEWVLLDPTFGANNTEISVTQFIGDGTEYETKYIY